MSERAALLGETLFGTSDKRNGKGGQMKRASFLVTATVMMLTVATGTALARPRHGSVTHACTVHGRK